MDATKTAASMNTTGESNPEHSAEIKADIDRTRARMDSTLNELEYRLNPRRVWNQITSTRQIDPQTLMQVATVIGGMLVTTVVFRAIRKHPISALAGAGVAWLLLERSAPAIRRVESSTVVTPLPSPADPAPGPTTPPVI
jgi:hypothetical protein